MVRRIPTDMGVYLVTGASRGIGSSLAVLRANEGHQVILLARDSPELKATTESVLAVSASSFAVVCDLASPESIAKGAEQILREVNVIDGLVHNAGAIHPVRAMQDASNAEWSRSIQVNLIGVQDLTQRLFSLLKGPQHSRVTTISSGASLRPIQSWSAYCTAKAGLDMWSRCLAEEGKEHNISSISVAPGVVDTGMQEDIRAVDPQHFPSHSTFVSLHDEGELAHPNDVADLLHSLVTGHSMEQSGQRFDVRDL
jgi:benzil reductase ((S)-benzoin forming)